MPRQSPTPYYQISTKGNPTPPNSPCLLIQSELHLCWDLLLLITLNIYSNLLQLIRGGFLCPTTYSLHCHHQNDCIKAGSCVSQFKVSLMVWAKSQDSVQKPQVWKRKESWSGSNRGAAYQPSALPLGHTDSLQGLSIQLLELYPCLLRWTGLMLNSRLSIDFQPSLLLQREARSLSVDW